MGSCRVKDVAKLINSFAPEASAESFDNVGLLVGDEETVVTGILVTLDVNDSTIDLAVSKGYNLIVSHHPLIFTPLKRVLYKDPVGRLVCRLLANGISVYAAHTNFDKAPCGTDTYLSEAIGLQEEGVLLQDSDDTGRGLGRFGKIAPCSAGELKKKLESAFGCGVVMTCHEETIVEKIASCAGAGGSLAECVVECSAELYITGEMSYHAALDLKRQGVDVMLLSHQLSEQGSMASLQNTLQMLLKGVKYNISVELEPAYSLFV